LWRPPGWARGWGWVSAPPTRWRRGSKHRHAAGAWRRRGALAARTVVVVATRHGPPRRLARRPRPPGRRRRPRGDAGLRRVRGTAGVRLPPRRSPPPGAPLHGGPQSLPRELRGGERPHRHGRGTLGDDLHPRGPVDDLPRDR